MVKYTCIALILYALQKNAHDHL